MNHRNKVAEEFEKAIENARPPYRLIAAVLAAAFLLGYLYEFVRGRTHLLG